MFNVWSVMYKWYWGEIEKVLKGIPALPNILKYLHTDTS